MMWKLIESAPKDGSSFLAYVGQWMTVCHWHRQQGCWASNGPIYSPYPPDEQPTHWMPLPVGPAKIEQATPIPMDDCGLWINCGRDGTWLHFEASNAPSTSINVESMIGRGSIIDAGLRGWCSDRQKQAQQIRADNGQFGVGA
jgi:Protein of unknown function (DUF551)